MDLYCRMGERLRALFKDLFDPRHKAATLAQMGEILKLARQIGGTIQEEAEQLNQDIEQFLATPSDPHRLAIMKKHAMRLSQETKEI